MSIHLQYLLSAKLSDEDAWPIERLRIWCRDVPILLLCALAEKVHDEDISDVDQQGLPRDKGPYDLGHFTSVMHYSILSELEADPLAWSLFIRWALRPGGLFREYEKREGKMHAGTARTWWVGWKHRRTAEERLGDIYGGTS